MSGPGAASDPASLARTPSEVWWTAREWPDWLPNIQQSEEAPRPGDPPNGWQCLPADVIHRILHVYKRELGSRVVRPACRILGQVNKHWHGALNAEVTSLQLRAGIPPGDISRLMRRFKYLERLRLQQCDQACLAAICAHPHSHMRVVDLQGCQEVTDEGLLRIGGLGRLQHLDLTNCVQVSDDGLQALTSLTSLRFLNLRVSWSGKTAAPVAACLRAFTPRGFSALGRLPSLTELSLKGRREVDDDMLLELAELSALASLKLSTTNITDRGVGVLAGLPSLSSLRMACPNVTDEGFRTLTALTALTCLRMSNCLQLTDEGVGAIARITSLSKLLIGHAPMAMDTGLQSLSQLVNLRALVLGYCGSVTAQGMRPLSRLQALSCVGFKRCPRVVRKELISLRAEIPTFLKLKLFCH